MSGAPRETRTFRIWEDESGESHVGELSVPLRLVDFAPPSPAMAVGELVPATGTHFLAAPPGWDSPLHRAPRRQYVVGLRGTIEARASDGSTFRLRPGDVVLLEDTTGVGHASHVVGDEDWLALVVVLNEQE